MSFELVCPADGSPLSVERSGSGRSCRSCHQHYPEEAGVVRFLDSTDEFYEGRYLNTVAFVPATESPWRAWPIWLMSSGYPWAVRHHVPAGANVMEMGCASGIAYFAARYRVLGLDLSFSSLAQVSPLYDTCIQADVTQRIPLPDACLDGIFSSYVWEHIPPADKPGALAELCRVLKPGGKLVFLFDVEGNTPIYRVLKRRDPDLYREVLIEREGHLGWESPEANREQFEAAGLRVLEYRGKDKLLIPPPMFDKVGQWGGGLKRLGDVGVWFSRGLRFQLANALLRLLDETAGRLLPLSWSRIVVAVCEKPRDEDRAAPVTGIG